MNYQITNTLTPTNTDGSIDQRYSESTQRLITKLGPEGIEAINCLREGQQALASKHGWAGKLIVDFFYEEATRIDNEEDHPHRWKSKRYLSQLEPILEANGFTSSQVSKLVQSKKFRIRLNNQAYSRRGVKVSILKYIELVESYGLSGQYVLSLMDEQGLRKAVKLTKQKESQLTIRELEDIKREYPRHPPKRNIRDIQVQVVPDDTPSSTELVIEETNVPTQYELAKELVAIAALIETKDGWKDPELIEILNQEADKLMSIAHIATLPVTKTITV